MPHVLAQHKATMGLVTH